MAAKKDDRIESQSSSRKRKGKGTEQEEKLPSPAEVAKTIRLDNPRLSIWGAIYTFRRDGSNDPGRLIRNLSRPYDPFCIANGGLYTFCTIRGEQPRRKYCCLHMEDPFHVMIRECPIKIGNVHDRVIDLDDLDYYIEGSDIPKPAQRDIKEGDHVELLEQLLSGYGGTEAPEYIKVDGLCEDGRHVYVSRHFKSGWCIGGMTPLRNLRLVDKRQKKQE